MGLAVIASSLIAFRPVESQSDNLWHKVQCDEEGKCVYISRINGIWPFKDFKMNSPRGKFSAEADCQQLKFRLRFNDGTNSEWVFGYQGEINEDIIQIVCS